MNFSVALRSLNKVAFDYIAAKMGKRKNNVKEQEKRKKAKQEKDSLLSTGLFQNNIGCLLYTSRCV